jgi:hypothetical protein
VEDHVRIKDWNFPTKIIKLKREMHVIDTKSSFLKESIDEE